jgi:hypothetical protein
MESKTVVAAGVPLEGCDLLKVDNDAAGGALSC